MFGVLLESRARRQRRTGGAALSAAAHLAIIGAVTTATTRGPSRPDKPAPIPMVRFTPPRTSPPRPASAGSLSASPSTTVIDRMQVARIDVPVVTPVGLPRIEPAIGTSLDTLIIGSTTNGQGPRAGSGLVDGGDGSRSDEWRGTELLMRVLTSTKPRYPESLRRAGIGGRVLVRFTVDTLGRIDPASIRILESTHELFSDCVREVLPTFRFKPAEVAGRHVPALGEMPFEFQVTR